MKAGKTGHLRIEKARKGLGKDKYIAATYYYAALHDSEYSFAFSFSDTDKSLFFEVFRRAQEPSDKSRYDKSYFNLLIEYNSTLARRQLPGTFEYLQVGATEKKYPGLRVSYLHSSIFLAPKCHCDPNAYFYDDDLARKTVDAHLYINGLGVDDVKWTYVGMRSGLFRTYPAHRSTRTYDPTKRSWYKRATSNPSKTSISTAYMDAAGVGKIITVSQALFEGITSRTTEECLNISASGPWPGGWSCYVSWAAGANSEHPRCATERVEAVTSLDILYSRFHEITTSHMQASDLTKSCGQKYSCPDGEPNCETRYTQHPSGTCQLCVTLAGIPANPEELDNYYKNKGPIPKFNNEFGCITDVVGYVVNETALGNVSGPCMSGFYYVTALPRTNLFLMLHLNHVPCVHCCFSIVNSGAYRIINGTCAHTSASTSNLAAEGKCPQLRNVNVPCTYTTACLHRASQFLVLTVTVALASLLS
ncbi:hypothetical protein NP493_1112g00008 [Ridgeia piscesae]|uniref:Uncharacterized protein n=1 Tax=Ridgeia piscesae TaxID=27915 RepID=A0AAD9KH66_RIDPI|nr:hypothetical protein NP493_1112g00008 [Ridgeia piscesae]